MAVVTVAFEDLDTWLQAQPENTIDTPYELEITGLTRYDCKPSNYTGSLGYKIKQNRSKYVDLSHTYLPNDLTTVSSLFQNCDTLVIPPEIPNNVTDMSYCFGGCANLRQATNIPNGVTNLNNCFKGADITIPPVIPNGVTNMNETFAGCSLLTTTPIIPNTVNNMQSCFEWCDALVEITNIPNSVTNLTNCFYGCLSLEVAPVIPSSVTIMNSTFYRCTSLTEAPVIPNNVTDMTSCFQHCTALTKPPIITNNVTNVDYCFSSCSSLEYKSIIPSGVSDNNVYTGVTQTRWGGSSSQIDDFVASQTAEFEVVEVEADVENNCYETTGRTVYGIDILDLDYWLSTHPVNTNLTPYEIKVLGLTSSNWTQIKDALTNNIYPKKFTDLSYTVLPSGITTIASGFENCALLVKAPQIPTSVLVMSSAFDSCISLVESPVIPNGVIGIQNCFKDCQSLIITPTIPSSVELMNNAFQNCKKITTPANIPSGVSNIQYLFSGCTSLQSAPTIPNSVRNMSHTFENCTSLVTAPIIPTYVTDMSYTFNCCTSLRTAPTLPQTATDITGVFAYCNKLEILTNSYYEIPANVTSMKDVFRNCSSLTDQMLNVILYLGTITNFDNTFEGCNKITTYKSIPSSVTSAKECFKNCTSLARIDELGISLNTLRDNTNFQNMFQNCSSLVQIGHKVNNDQNWHVMSLNIGASTVSGKVYDKDGFPTTISSTSITKTTMTLPNLTDEIMFPPNSLSDADLETLIQNVISSKYTWWKRQAINPNQKTFVLYADNPNNVITNIAGGGGTDIKVYDTLAEAEADLANLSVGDIIGTEQGGDGAVDAVTSGDMRLVTSNAVAVELLNGSAWTKVNNFNDLIYKKVGNTVFLHLSSSGVKFPSSGGSLTINATSTAISLPSAIRPKYIINVALLDNTYDNVYHGRINTDGSIVAWDSAVRAVNQISSWQFDICYRID